MPYNKRLGDLLGIQPEITAVGGGTDALGCGIWSTINEYKWRFPKMVRETLHCKREHFCKFLINPKWVDLVETDTQCPYVMLHYSNGQNLIAIEFEFELCEEKFKQKKYRWGCLVSNDLDRIPNDYDDVHFS